MKRVPSLSILTLALVVVWPAAGRAQGDTPVSYDVTVTNLTRDQQFTPLLVVSHRAPSELFSLGESAQAGLVTLAEEGDIAPLAALFAARPDVLEIDTNGALLDPGASATVTVAGQGAGDKITLAAMLIPTNDGFVALLDAVPPRPGRTVVFRAPAYDSGSEQNDELCESIPGPFFEECGGPGGGGSPGNGEGFVHIHAGIHGIGDMTEANRDWRNPVAEIVVTANN